MYECGAGSRRALARQPASQPRFVALDGVRGLCIIGVVVWHLFGLVARSAGITPSNVPVGWWPIGTGRFGVDAFFVLSGFFVVQGVGRGTWRATRERSASFFAAAREFGRRRARRILPAYWLSLLVLVPLIAPALLRQPKQLFLFFTVNQYVVHDLPGQVNTVLWSLTTEWHFYLLVPLVGLLVRRVGNWPVLAGSVALAVVWCSHVPPLGLPSGFIFGRLDHFVAGAVAAELVAHADGGTSSSIARLLGTRRAFVAAVGGILAIGTYCGSTMGHSRGSWFDSLVHPLVGLCVAVALVRLCAVTPQRPTFIHSRPLRLAGLVSFSLYLWHLPILVHGLRWVGVSGPIGALDAVRIALVLAGSVAIAVVSYGFVERPFLEGARRRASVPDDHDNDHDDGDRSRYTTASHAPDTSSRSVS